MSSLKIDLDLLNSTKNAINKSLEALRGKYTEIQTESQNMSSNWQGKDYDEFINKVEGLKEANSNTASAKVEKELESFGKYLERCYNEYQKVQNDLKDLAGKLPR